MPSTIVRARFLLFLLMVLFLGVVVDVGGFEGVLRLWYS